MNMPKIELPIDVSQEDFMKAMAAVTRIFQAMLRDMPASPSAINIAFLSSLANGYVQAGLTREAFLERAAKVYDHAVAMVKFITSGGDDDDEAPPEDKTH